MTAHVFPGSRCPCAQQLASFRKCLSEGRQIEPSPCSPMTLMAPGWQAPSAAPSSHLIPSTALSLQQPGVLSHGQGAIRTGQGEQQSLPSPSSAVPTLDPGYKQGLQSCTSHPGHPHLEAT